jgi:hypothetical protein
VSQVLVGGIQDELETVVRMATVPGRLRQEDAGVPRRDVSVD